MRDIGIAAGRGSITLTDVLDALDAVRTWTDFAECLRQLNGSVGRSLDELERAGRDRARGNSAFRELERGTVSDALNGKRRLNRSLLVSLLAAWEVPERDQDPWLLAWRRATADAGRSASQARRFDEASARELGIHNAIEAGDATGDLPTYVARDFDDRLLREIAVGAQHGRFVILVGGSSTGKTRSLYEAVHDVVPNWWLIQPTETQDIVELLDAPPERTVLWLDELHRFLGTDPPLTRQTVTNLVRAGTIVVGTLWPDDYAARKTPRQAGVADRHADDRRLLEFAEVISVPAAFSADERDRAERIAAKDGRIRIALDTRDAGLTQVLAAGPDVVHRWEQAPDSYARAVITVAADARRLGVHAPLSHGLLIEAMFDYLPPAHRITPAETWLKEALPYARMPLLGAVAALSPVDGGKPGTLGGYVVADYLAQHCRRTRRVVCPPHSLWEALVKHVDNVEDLRRLALSARARMRYQYAVRALERLAVLDDGPANAELATVLVGQDRIEDAIVVLQSRLRQQPDKTVVKQLNRLAFLRWRTDELRRLAEGGDAVARERLHEVLADCGETDELREEADLGNGVAADELAERLASRGCLRELGERADAGHRFAADLLADILAAQGRVEALRRRADAGDEAAKLRLDNLLAAVGGAEEAILAQVATLRKEADAGNEQAASQLTALLFELRDEDELRAEVNAGTYRAAERLIALLTSDNGEPRHLYQIRAFGLNADGSTHDPT